MKMWPGRKIAGRIHTAPRANMTASPSTPQPSPRLASFREFYPFYLAQHTNATCRRLHVVGTLTGLAIAVVAVISGRPGLILPALLAGYLPAWVGHYFFEHNTPATFRYPLYSLRGDFVMLGQILTGRTRW